MQTIQINENISLHYIPMEKLKTTTIGLYIHHVLSKDAATKTALLPYVLRRGCRAYPTTDEIAKELENLYGAQLHTGITKKGEDHVMIFDAETISDRYAPQGEALVAQTISLLLACVFDPLTEANAFSADYVKQEKANLKDRIESMINDKAYYAMQRCTEEMFRNDVFAISQFGCLEDVDKISAEELFTHYQSIITSSVIDIYVCGETTLSSAEQAIRESISSLTFAPAHLPHSDLLTKNKTEINRVTDHLDVTQGKLSIGLRTNIRPSEEEYWGLMVANSIFGGGAHSKLFNNVREKLSLAYYASSQLNKNKGLMFVNAGIEFQNFDAAYNEIVAQLDAMKNGQISDEEMNASIKAILTVLDSYYDNGRYIQSFYLGEKISGTNHDIADVRERVQKVTKDEIVKAAQKIELDTVYFLTGKEEA